MKKLHEGKWFRCGYFILAALSFNSLTAGQSFMRFLIPVVLVWGAVLCLLRLFSWRSFLCMPCLGGCALFLCSYGISTWFNRSYGLGGNLKALSWMGLEFFGLYLFSSMESPESRKKGIRTLAAVVLAYAGLQAVISIAMLAVGYQGISVERGMYIGIQEGRLWGAYSDPNYGAVLAVSTLVLALGGSFLTGWKKYRPLLWGIAALQYIYLVFSYSRTGMVCLAAALISLYLYWFFTRKKSWFLRGALALGILLLCFGGNLLIQGYNRLQRMEIVYAADTETADTETAGEGTPGLSETISESAAPGENDEVLHREEHLAGDISNGRFAIWKDGLAVFLTSPVYGITYRNIASYTQEHFPDNYMNEHAVTLNTFHNMFVDVLVSQGALGFLILTVTILWMAVKTAKGFGRQSTENRDFAFWMISGLLPIMIGALFLSDILYINTPTSVVFWSFLGGILMEVTHSSGRGIENEKSEGTI